MISSDEDMERLLLRYFINDEWAARGFQSLDTVFEQVGRPSGWRNSFFNHLETPIEKGALSAILERMASDGLLDEQISQNGGEKFFRASDRALENPRYDYLYPKFGNVAQPEAVPASNRTVALDHNSPEYQQIVDELEILAQEVRTNNALGDTPEERDRLLHSLDAAQRLWGAAELKIIQVKVGIIMAVEDAGKALEKVGKEVGWGMLIQGIIQFVKKVSGLDI